MDGSYLEQIVKLLNGAGQAAGAAKDLTKSYIDMRKDNTIGNDDYFHCVGNFNAARRGDVGSETARVLGDTKEGVDYYINQYYKGLSQPAAYNDYLWDKGTNQISRQRAKSGVYSDYKDACNIFRVNGINEKY